MLKIEKLNDYTGDIFKIHTDAGKFSICFGGNLDLYWYYESENIENEEKKEFVITKENYVFYKLIDILYNKIKNYDVSYNDKPNKNLQISLKKDDEYNPRKLFKNNKVEWHSDDYTYEDSAILTIELVIDKYIIIFYRGMTDMRDYVFSIRFCNSGSRYQPFNVVFMQMYNKLMEYDPNYHQIHMEEYLYELTRTRKKSQ